MAIDRDPETFTSTQFVNLEEVDDDLIAIRRSMLESDGTRHRALRQLLQRDFGGRTLRKYEDFLRGLTEVTVDAALPQASSTSSRRSAPTSRSRCWPGCSTCPTTTPGS